MTSSTRSCRCSLGVCLSIRRAAWRKKNSSVSLIPRPIPGKDFQSPRFLSFHWENHYLGDCYIRVLCHTFYRNFCRDIEYSLLYREYGYIENGYIGVPLYMEKNLDTYTSNETLL